MIELGRFVSTLEGMRVLQRFESGDRVAMLCDCNVSQPAGTYRFAEFIRVHGDAKSKHVRLVFDATEFRK